MVSNKKILIDRDKAGEDLEDFIDDVKFWIKLTQRAVNMAQTLVRPIKRLVSSVQRLFRSILRKD